MSDRENDGDQWEVGFYTPQKSGYLIPKGWEPFGVMPDGELVVRRRRVEAATPSPTDTTGNAA